MLRTKRKTKGRRSRRGRLEKTNERSTASSAHARGNDTFCEEDFEHSSFSGVFTRDVLQKRTRAEHECGVVNLDDASGDGTHFVAYVKRGRTVRYFDLFGPPPPPEFLRYARGNRVTNNTRHVQNTTRTIVISYPCNFFFTNGRRKRKIKHRALSFRVRCSCHAHVHFNRKGAEDLGEVRAGSRPLE